MSDILSNILDQVSNITGMVSGAEQQNKDATASISANNAALDSSYMASAARGQAVADATQVVSSAKQTGELVAQTATQSYAHALGVDADGTLSAQQSQAQDTFLDASQRAHDAAAVIAQKRSVSFMDDPLGWLTNKLTINDDINNFNGAANEANTAEQFIQDTNQLIDQRAVALKAVQTVTSQAAAEAQTKILVSQVQEQAATLQRQGIAANTQGVEAVSNLSWRGIQLASTGLDADAKYVQMQNDQERLALSKEQLGMEQQRLNIEKAKEQEKDGANQYMVAQLRKGLQLMYPNNPAAWNIPDGKYQAMITGKTPLDPVWKKAFDVAQDSDQMGTDGSRVLGTSPADALSSLSFKPTVAPSAQPTVDLLNRAQASVVNSPQFKQLITAKDTKGAEDMINQAVAQLVKSDSQHVNSPTSLYYLPPIDKLADNIPGMQQSPFYQTIVAPAKAAGVDLSNPTQVAQAAVQAVKDGKISLNEAANNMSAMYGIGQQWNFQAKQMFALGITAPPSYTTPVSGITPTGSNGNLGQVDWTNELQVKEMMMRMSATNQTLIDNPRTQIFNRVR